MNKNLALAGVVALVVSLAVCAAFPKQVQQVVQQLGAVVSQDLPDKYYSIGGVKYASVSQGFMASSTNFCIIKNPFATSTLVSADLNVFTNPLGSVNYDLATSSVSLNGGNGTSTPRFISSATVGTGQTYHTWVPLASTTQTADVKGTWGLVQDPGTLASGIQPNGLGTNNGFVLKPGEALSWKIATSVTSTSFTSFPTGRCNATFRSLGN